MALSRPIPLQSRQAMASLLSDPPSLVAAVSLRPGAGPSPSSAGTRRSTGAGQAQRAQARPAVPCVILASLSSSSSPKRASKTHPAVSATPPSAAAAAAAAAAGASSVLSPPPPAPTPAPAPTPKLPREPNGTASHYGEAASSPAAASVASPGLGIVEFLRGKNIIITGATGFLAKGMRSTSQTQEHSQEPVTGSCSQSKDSSVKFTTKYSSGMRRKRLEMQHRPVTSCQATALPLEPVQLKRALRWHMGAPNMAPSRSVAWFFPCSAGGEDPEGATSCGLPVPCHSTAVRCQRPATPCPTGSPDLQMTTPCASWNQGLRGITGCTSYNVCF